MQQPNVRIYVKDPAHAKAQIRKIVSLLAGGRALPVVYFDTETQPKPGLEAYPTTIRGALDIKVNTGHYQRWLVWVTYKYFDVQKFEDVGNPVPLTFRGKYAIAHWKSFATKILENPELYASFMQQDSELDFAYWLHALYMAHEKRPPSKDPVKPGLNPHDSELFAVQVTLEDSDHNLISWVFNIPTLGLEVLRPLMVRKEKFVGQNLKFDVAHMRHNMGEDCAPENVGCTLVADKILSLGIKGPRTLNALAKKYLDVDIDKAVRNTFVGVRRQELTENQIEYSFFDTEVLAPLWREIQARAESTQQTELIDTYSRLSWLVSKWELEGYGIDQKKWLELTARATTLRDEAGDQLELMLLGSEYNLNLDVELEKVIDEDDEEPEAEVEDEEEEEDGEGENYVDPRRYATISLGQTAIVAEIAERLLGFTDDDIDEELRTKKGSLSLSKDSRATLEHIFTKKNGATHDFFGLYATWATMAKQASTYGKKFLRYIHPKTQRVHPLFGIAGTETSRFTSSAPNFLNLPRGDAGIDVRQAVIAQNVDDARALIKQALTALDVGNLGLCEELLGRITVLGSADYATFEARAAAEVTRDPGMVAIFQQGVDYHSGAAVLAFHMKLADVSEAELHEENFRVGSVVHKIKVWHVPADWATDQRLAFALLPEQLALVVKPTRQLAKIVNFLTLFGGGAYTLAAKVNIAVEQAQEVLDIFRQAFPTLFEEIAVAEQLPFTENLRVSRAKDGRPGRSVGFIESIGHLRRYFMLPTPPERSWFAWDDEGYELYQAEKKKFFRRKGAIRRASFNLLCQGLNALVTAEALLLVQERGKPFGIVPYLSVYDQIMVLMPASTTPSVYLYVLQQSMLDAAEKYISAVPVLAELDPPAAFWQKEFSKAEKHAWETAVASNTPWNTLYLEANNGSY